MISRPHKPSNKVYDYINLLNNVKTPNLVTNTSWNTFRVINGLSLVVEGIFRPKSSKINTTSALARNFHAILKPLEGSLSILNTHGLSQI